MRLIISIIFLFVFTISKSQNIESITIGTIDKIHSNILKEDRKIWIYNPAENNKKNIQRYPVLYLLDAEEHFYATVGMIKQMKGVWPEMIVVGITNTNRNRDLTPTANNSGGGENFMNFVEKELIPHIDSTYPTAPYRIFSGHSLGGLTVVNTLLNNTRLFNAYIAIDPSLWWNNKKLVQQAKQDFFHKKYTKLSLFIGRSNNMPPKMDTLTALKDTTQYTALYRSVTQFVNDLKKTDKNELRWTSKFYPKETHGTVQLNGQYDALKFLFDYYQFRTSMFELNPNLNIDSVLTAHFKNISQKLGYTVLPSQDLVNNLGYTCMGLKKWDKAETFFKMNTDNYPQDANSFDSMGDFYEARGDIKKAIENFTKALTLGNDTETRRKLDKLKGKN
ncbi:alpha/beta hydrolase-fold protein [Chryseobacterium sp. SIMBA_029]|uniref:alpha/beta hydrolase-fold protein n=3 Tax=Bacteria TaxID=2 RepID=UPI00397D0DC0